MKFEPGGTLWSLTLVVACLVHQASSLQQVELPTIGEIENVTARNGEDVYLDCPVIKKTNASIVQWFRVVRYLHISNDDTIITKDTDKYAVKVARSDLDPVRPLDITTLIIKNVGREDIGRYRCRVQIRQVPYTQWPMKDGFLTIEAAPQILSLGNTKVVTSVGDDVTLTCRVYGSPTPTVTWHKGDAGRNIMGHGEVLHLVNVQAGDGGEYRCRATNGILPNVEEPYHITIKQPPLCSAPDLHVMQAPNIHQDAIMTCFITGYPIPTAIWRRHTIHGIKTIFTSKYDIQLLMPKDNSGVLTSVVRVHNVTESDYGTYICEGRNELAECKAEVRLLESPVCMGPRCPGQIRHEENMDLDHTHPVTPSGDDKTQQGHQADGHHGNGAGVAPMLHIIHTSALTFVVYVLSRS